MIPVLKDITFGQYFEGRSVIHRMDPRAKILLLTVNIVFLFLTKNIYSLLVPAVQTLFVLIISRVPAKMFLRNIKTILPIIIFTTVINLFYGVGGTVLVTFWPLI